VCNYNWNLSNLVSKLEPEVLHKCNEPPPQWVLSFNHVTKNLGIMNLNRQKSVLHEEEGFFSTYSPTVARDLTSYRYKISLSLKEWVNIFFLDGYLMDIRCPPNTLYF
jgi:hypothetical protein